MMKNIDVVGKYLDEIDYKNIITAEKKRINELLEKGEGLNSVDSKKFEFIYLHCTSKEGKQKYSVLVFKERLLMTSEFTMEFFEKAMIDFISFVCLDSGLTKDSFLVSIKELKGQHGVVKNGKELVIDRERIRKLYSNTSVLSIITVFHEVRHLVQRQLYQMTDKPNSYVFTMLKERVISSYSDYYKEEYYDKNYNKLSTELDAQYYAIINAREWFERLGVFIDDKYEQKFLQELNRLSDLKKDLVREVDGLEDTVDNLFDLFIIDKPELLKEWPYLKYQYTSDDGKTVRNKNREELIEQWETFDFSKMTDEETRNAKLFLLQLINNQKGENVEQQTHPSKK